MAPTRRSQSSTTKPASQKGPGRVDKAQKQQAQKKVRENQEALEHAIEKDGNVEEVKKYEELLSEAQADLDAMEVEEVGAEATETANRNNGGTSVEVKSESEEESLFANSVEGGQESRNGGGQSQQDDEDETGLVDHLDCLDVAAGIMVKFYKLSNRYYAIDEYGTGNRKKYAIRKLPAKPEGEEYKGMNLDTTDEIAEKEKIYQILGVAWQTKSNLSRMKTISFENWTQEKNSIRRRAPNMRVKIRWDGPTGPESWEKRAGLRKNWFPDSRYRGVIGNDRFDAPENVKYDGIEILNKGVEIFKADYAVIDSAVRYEKRYDELKEAEKQGKKFEAYDRDPTPGAPLRSENRQGPTSG